MAKDDKASQADLAGVTDPIVREALEVFEVCGEAEEENRRHALDDLRFGRLSEQWPEQVRRSRLEQGRPCLTINKIPAFVRQVVNDVRQNAPAITIHPVDSDADVHTALIMGGLIRNIETCSDADIAYDTACESAVSGGFGYFRINIQYADDDTFDKDIAIRRIVNPFSVWGDPRSTAADSSDWNVAFVTDTMSLDDFKRKYKGADPVDWQVEPYCHMHPSWRMDDDIQVAEYWKRGDDTKTIVLLSDGTILDEDVFAKNKDLLEANDVTVVGERKVRTHKVTQYVMNGVEVLEKVDWVGKYIPIVPVYGEEVFVEKKRHLRSLIRDAKDPQQNFNYWRTNATETVALAPRAPWIGPTGFAKKDPRWATANTQNHSYLEYEGNQMPQRTPFAGIPAGALQEAANSADDMKAIMGLFDASLGAPSNETSGRAILMRQKEGDVSNFHFSDNLSRAIRHAGRIMVDLIPHVYTGQRVVRTMGADGKPQNVPINQPVIIHQPQDGQPAQPPQPVQLPPPGQQIQIPDGGLLHVFNMTNGKYDLTVEAGPSYTTQREAAAEQMFQLLQAFPQAAPVIGDLLVKNLDWPGAQEIAQRLQALAAHTMQGQPGAPGAAPPINPMQVQQLVQKLQQLMQQNQMLTQKVNNLQQDKSLELLNAQVKGFDAQTKRAKVIIDAHNDHASNVLQYAAHSQQQTQPQQMQPQQPGLQ
jgi:hypothetical protein